MYKKMAPIVATVLATGMILSGTAAYAAPKENKSEEVGEKAKGKQEDKQKQNKGQTQQLKSVDKQLDKIEEKLNHYHEKLSEKGDQSIKTPIEGDEPVDVPIETEQEEQSTEAIPDTVESEQTTEESNDFDLTDAEIEDEVEEVEEDLKENQGYVGKFHALQNRLNAITKQLDSLASKGMDSTILAERYDRVVALTNEVEEALATVNQIQDQIQEEIEKDYTVQEKTSVTDAPLTKEWNIKFSKILDTTTLSNLDIIVLDAERSLVETTVNYSDTSQTVTISPLQPYKAGETYTLYIGKGISGKDGSDLVNSVKMNFTVQ